MSVCAPISIADTEVLTTPCLGSRGRILFYIIYDIALPTKRKPFFSLNPKTN